jgi:hypothetical protein
MCLVTVLSDQVSNFILLHINMYNCYTQRTVTDCELNGNITVNVRRMLQCAVHTVVLTVHYGNCELNGNITANVRRLLQ